MSPNSRPRVSATWPRPILAVALTAALPWLAGCGGEEIEVVPVTGTVTLNGKPLEGATVLFSPADGGEAVSPGMDTTGPEGNYNVQYNGRLGVAPGKYTVLVSKEYNPAVANADSAMAEEDPEMLRMMAEPEPGENGPTITKQAAKIIEASESFDREVKAGEENIFEFDLKATAEDAKVLRGNP